MAWIGAVTGVVRCGGGPWEPHPGESSGTDFRGRVRRGYGEAYSEGGFEYVECECGGDGLFECVQGAAVVGASGFSRP